MWRPKAPVMKIIVTLSGRRGYHGKMRAVFSDKIGGKTFQGGRMNGMEKVGMRWGEGMR